MKVLEKEKSKQQKNTSKPKDPNEFILIKNNKKANPKSGSEVLIIFAIFATIFFLIATIIFCAFTFVNSNSTTIIKGVYIKNIDVSGLTKEEAKEKIDQIIVSSIPDEISLTHNNFETSISKDQLSIYFNTEEAVDIAYSIGRNGNIFSNDFKILETAFANINIDPGFVLDEKQLKLSLKDISGKLPDKLENSSYYIEDNNLVITKGHEGSVIKINDCANHIKDSINNLYTRDHSIELITEIKQPSEINIDEIYKEIHKDPIDAYYTQNPFSVVPSENGLDFNISIDEAKNLLNEEKNEYVVPLKVLYPNVTTNMIGTEAFPDLLSDFSTKYAASNRNRTTNLVLASNKINGTVLMPGEVFSYNKVVGARTIAAGYKEAPIYVSGRVEDGLGGGICQITTTLYNAALFANLEIVERSNHQFVPSYVGASRDATVVYGAIDFKFKNNRDYPIKLVCSVANGIANFKIFGMKTANDYEVEITTRTTGSTRTAIYSEAYKTLKQNGNVISTETISKDTYKRH